MPLVLLSDNVRTLILVNVLLVWKLMLASNITSGIRMSRKVFANPEDYVAQRMSPSTQGDAAVDRSRRAHQNDLENILPFMPLSLLYVLTSPPHALFASLSWGFLAARVLYTVFYLRGMQPWRSIAFGVGMLSAFAMGVLSLIAL